MCGIVAVLRKPGCRAAVPLADVTLALDAVAATITAGELLPACVAIEFLDDLLRGVGGVITLIAEPEIVARTERVMAGADEMIRGLERSLDTGDVPSGPALEELNATIVRLKDAAWAVSRDRLPTALAVAGLAGENAGPAAVEACTSIQVALSAIDRLEVRGRDSAGIHLLVSGHGLDLDAPDLAALIAARASDPLFTSLAVRVAEGHLSFVYKAAAEIGELGDNTASIRRAVTDDLLLRRALAADTAACVVLGHTRWASVGIISQANAHPLNHEEEGIVGPYVTAALNGDVDNYGELRSIEGLRIPVEVTTDAKVIPALISRRLAAGQAVEEGFRATVASFEGSVAIAAHAASDPDKLLLALRGSGQALYLGLADDSFVVASEPYGLVEVTPHYVRMDGESGGQVVVLDAGNAGSIDGIRRVGYDGTEVPVTDDDVVTAEITTRDIDRAGYPHYLLKEVTEAAQSFRKTLRGKIAEDDDGRLTVVLGDETLPADLRSRLAAGGIARVVVIGQGTAAVAGRAVAAAIADSVAATPMLVSATHATELSGFALDDDMSDMLIIAISQSGTTTDTNRTVDLVRGRGATVIGIVNRRNSDLVDKADGVLYTSDGRDVEMSVPSTKAFYAQLAAGFLLADALARELGVAEARTSSDLLAALRELPDAMEAVVARRDDIADAAFRYAPSRRYWAIVGNGPNRIAAEEIRIKLSELCYKSVACDTTEDKKHVDLSAEPLILVCAAGLTGANADDVAKEVSIYRAHKAAPIVIATDGEERFSSALHTIHVPPVHPRLAFVLSAMAGHLFGYEAALSIDAQARVLREARAAIEAAVSIHLRDPDGLLERLSPLLEPAAARFFDTLRSGAYDGHMEASTAVRLSAALRYACGWLPLEAYEVEHGKVGTPAVVVEELTDALTRGIEELTRPIDAIKHQAKTVTVGISRSEESLFTVPLVDALLTAGARRDGLSYRSLRTLAQLDSAVGEVTGFTRYRIEGGVADGATIHVIEKGGIARDLPSRTDWQPALTGTKHRAAFEREVTVARGARDGRMVVLVPETKGNQVTGLTLLHVSFADTLSVEEVRAVLEGYRNRYAALVDAVTETEPAFDDSLLAVVGLADLLVLPVHVLADHWRGQGRGGAASEGNERRADSRGRGN